MSRQDLSRILTSIGPNQTITIETVNATQNLTFTLVTASEPEPDFTPDFTFQFVAAGEQIIPGTIDFSHSASATLSYVAGSYQPPTWSSITQEIRMWEYVKAMYPHYALRADLEIAKLDKQLESHSRSGFIGILGVYDSAELKPGLEAYTEPINFIEGLMFFMFLINIGVGTFNMLPIGPLDGGRMWGIVFQKISKKHAKAMLSIATWIIIAIIVADFAFVLF
jgi:membrane-associated protease RseP (regulator of RpoE activity)